MQDTDPSEELHEQFQQNEEDITSNEPSETIHDQFSENAKEITGTSDDGGPPDYDELTYELKP